MELVFAATSVLFLVLAVTFAILYRRRGKIDQEVPTPTVKQSDHSTSERAVPGENESSRSLEEFKEGSQATTGDGEDQRVPLAASYLQEAFSFLKESDQRRQRLARDLEELDREIKASEGYRAHSRMTSLRDSYFIFEGNELNLRHALKDFEQSQLFSMMWEARDQGRIDLFVGNLTRLFHNYLAGAATLLDHTYTLIEESYQGTSFADEYQERVNQRFQISLIPHFIEDLRNYMRHEGLPLALAELSVGGISSGPEVNSAIKLELRKFREWDKWSDKGLEYINSLDERVRLYDIVAEYSSEVDDLYRWFGQRQSEFHRETLKEFEELELRRKRLQKELARVDEGLLEGSHSRRLTDSMGGQKGEPSSGLEASQ